MVPETGTRHVVQSEGRGGLDGGGDWVNDFQIQATKYPFLSLLVSFVRWLGGDRWMD